MTKHKYMLQYNMILSHPYRKTAKKKRIFDNVNNYKEFVKAFEGKSNKEFGEGMFELVWEGVERFYKNAWSTDYEVYPRKDDKGAEATSRNPITGAIQVYQAKAKLDKNSGKSADYGELSKTIAWAKDKYPDQIIDNDQIIFVLLCRPNKELLKRGYKFILPEDIKPLLDNPAFWEQFRQWIDIAKPKEITEKKELTDIQSQKIVNNMTTYSGSKVIRENHGIDTGAGKSLMLLRKTEEHIKTNNLKNSLTIWGTSTRPLADQIAMDIMLDRKIPFKILVVDSSKDVDIDGELVDGVDGYEIPPTITHTEDQEEVDEFVTKKGHKILVVCYPSSGKVKKHKADVLFGDEFQALCGRYSTYDKNSKTWDDIQWKQDFIGIKANETHFVSGSAPWCNFYSNVFNKKKVKFRDADHIDFGSSGVRYSKTDSVRDGLTVPSNYIFYECEVEADDDTAVNKLFNKKKINYNFKSGLTTELSTKDKKKTALGLCNIKDAIEYSRTEFDLNYEKAIAFFNRVNASKIACDPNNPFSMATYMEGPMLHVDGTIKGDAREQILNTIKESINGVLTNVGVVREGVNVADSNILIIMKTISALGSLLQAHRHLRLHPVDRKNLNEGRIKVGDHTGWRKPYGVTIIPVPKGFFSSKAENKTHDGLATMIDHLLVSGPLHDVIENLVIKAKDENVIPSNTGTIPTKNIYTPKSKQSDVEKYIQRKVIQIVKTRAQGSIDKNRGKNILREYREFMDNGELRSRPLHLSKTPGKSGWDREMVKKYCPGTKLKNRNDGVLKSILALNPQFVSADQKAIHIKWMEDRAKRLDPMTGENANFVREYIKFVKSVPLMSQSAFDKKTKVVSKKDAKKYGATKCTTASHKGQYTVYGTNYYKTKYGLSDNMYSRLTKLDENDRKNEYSKLKDKSKAREQKRYFTDICDERLYDQLVDAIENNYVTRAKAIEKLLNDFLKHLRSLTVASSEQKDLYATVMAKNPDLFKPGQSGSNNKSNLLDKMSDPQMTKLFPTLVKQCQDEKVRLKTEWPEKKEGVLKDFEQIHSTKFPNRDPGRANFAKKGQTKNGKVQKFDGLEYQLAKKYEITTRTVKLILDANNGTDKGRTKNKQSSKKYKCKNDIIRKKFQKYWQSLSNNVLESVMDEEQKLKDRLNQLEARKKQLAKHVV